MISSSVHDLQHRLLAWFANNSRDLPWRRTYHPYHIWISEIMLPQNPGCDRCPYRNGCQSLELGIVGQRPVPGKGRETIFIEMATGVLVDKGKIFIQQRQKDDVWPNLWEFPGGGLQDGETPEEALTREYLEETELRIRVQEKIAVIKHSYTKYRVTLHCYICGLAGRKKKPKLHAAQDYRWVAAEDLKKYAFPAPHRRLIEKIAAMSG